MSTSYRTESERGDDMHGGAVIRYRLYPFIVGYNAENSLIEISSYMQCAHKKSDKICGSKKYA